MTKSPLEGRRAIVTGGAKSMGLHFARALANAGANVALGDVVEGDTVAADIHAETGRDCFYKHLDVSDEQSAEAFCAETAARFGGIDILVNNAGLTRDNLAMRMKDEDWQTVLDVNLTASFLLSKACLRGMMKQRFGRIIGITSVVGVTGNAGQANYAASKAGMIGMSKSLAQEVASRGITVNCVAPGFIVTPMTDELSDEQKAGLLGAIPSGRLGEVEDIATSVVYLASDEASYVTGQTLHVNGGMAMI